MNVMQADPRTPARGESVCWGGRTYDVVSTRDGWPEDGLLVVIAPAGETDAVGITRARSLRWDGATWQREEGR